MRSVLFSLLVVCLSAALSVLAHLPGRAEDQCVTNADCLRRRLPLLKPRRLHQGAQSADRRAFDPITIDASCSSTTPTKTIQQLQPGIYEFTATGAQGGGSLKTAGPVIPGGRGAKQVVTYNVTTATVFDILAGCAGSNGQLGGGGGGGTFIAVGSTPIVISAGGGGAGDSTTGSNAPAVYTMTGGGPNPQNSPGQGGNSVNSNFNSYGAGGGGFFGDGQSTGNGLSQGGKAYVNGGAGGAGSGRGGSGGGGGSGYGGGGGAGGYTGGSANNNGPGGAGGSYYDPGSSATAGYLIFISATYDVAPSGGNGQVVIQQTA